MDWFVFSFFFFFSFSFFSQPIFFPDSEIHQKILSHFFLLRHDTKCDNNAKMAEELYEKIGRPVLTWEYAKKFLLPLLSLEDEAVRRMAAKVSDFNNRNYLFYFYFSPITYLFSLSLFLGSCFLYGLRRSGS